MKVNFSNGESTLFPGEIYDVIELTDSLAVVSCDAGLFLYDIEHDLKMSISYEVFDKILKVDVDSGELIVKEKFSNKKLVFNLNDIKEPPKEL